MGNNLQQLNFNSRKMPLPLDVRIPLQDVGVKLQPQKSSIRIPAGISICWIKVVLYIRRLNIPVI